MSKTFLVMKLSVILLTICLQVSAEGFSQKIRISQKNVPLSKVFTTIEQQSGYRFFYDNKLIKQTGKVTVELKSSTLEQAMEQILKGLPLTYAIVDQTIVVKKKAVLVPDAFLIATKSIFYMSFS